MRRATTFIRQLGGVVLSGLRLPTETEWDTEIASWGTSNAAGAYGSPLKLSVAGWRTYTNGRLLSVGSQGRYWSSTITGSTSQRLIFDASSAQVTNDDRADGFSVRLIAEGTYSQLQFNAISSDTIEIDSITYGYCYNSTTERIWLDRNMGASQVATGSTDTNAYGDLYQWGRYRDGHQVRTSSTTYTLSSSDTPAHGDFIIPIALPNDWRDPQNDNLWQGVSGINNPAN
jgi:hypothetical protein